MKEKEDVDKELTFFSCTMASLLYPQPIANKVLGGPGRGNKDRLMGIKHL